MKEKATIFDFVRMCKAQKYCKDCHMDMACYTQLREDTDEASEIILKWCKEHPVETRQDRFLKMFPNAKVTSDGLVGICPQWCDKQWKCELNIYSNNIENNDCNDCLKKYWLAEVKENE